MRGRGVVAETGRKELPKRDISNVSFEREIEIIVLGKNARSSGVMREISARRENTMLRDIFCQTRVPSLL